MMDMNSFDLTTEEEINMLDEVDGEFYNWDQNHSGFLWLTDECGLLSIETDKEGMKEISDCAASLAM